MRTKEYKIEGVKVVATLVAGGPSFKLYALPNEAYLIVKGRIKLVCPAQSKNWFFALRYEQYQMTRNAQDRANFLELVASII